MIENRDGQVVTFYSYKGGTGRTMALANVAWILAANGKRVLAVDWDLESPGLFRFFAPFISPSALARARGVIELIQEYEWATAAGQVPPTGFDRFASVKKYSFSLQWSGFPGDGTLDYLSAGQQNHDYATTLAATSWDDFYEHRSGGEFFDALRADMKRHYDYVLIDSRTGLSDVADICTKQLPDILVDCFTLSDQGIDGAAQVAHTVREDYRRRNIRILPVPMRVDPAEKQKADTGRTVAMQRFAGLPIGMSENERQLYWNSVQVPYQAFYAYEEALATFGDAPGGNGTLLSAYEKLTRYVTNGEVSTLPPVEPTVRKQINARFERRATAVEDAIVLRYAPPDQVWAEWIEHVLIAAGLRVVESPPPDIAPGEQPDDEDQPVVAPVPKQARELRVISLANAIEERAYVASEGPAKAPLAVYIADITPLDNVPIPNSAFVAGLPETTAAERVLALVDRLPTDVSTLLAGGPRYPGSETEIFNVPARNTRFTGRENHLWRLRTYLRSGAPVVLQGKQPAALQGMPVALQGMGGVGKTQLAIEYAHRFRSAYDVVWWMSTDPIGDIENSLTDLGDRLGIDSESSGPDTARAVLQALSRHRQRWLLIYDNADEPDALRPFLPHGGHVLITSRNPLWGDRAQELSVDVFLRRESVAHLLQRVPELRPEDAWQVAEQLADLPIAIAAAGAWLADTGTPVDEYLRYIRDRGPSAMREPASDQSIDKTWDLSLQRLRERSQAAYRLFQLCSVMAPEIALDLVYSDELAACLKPYDPRVSERLVRGSLVQQINRLALLRVDQRGEGLGRDSGRGGQVLVHRVLQAVVRSRMRGDELAEARRQVQHVLAAARPEGDVDEPENWHRFRTLWPHLDLSEAVGSDAEAVRRLVIDRVRYQWLQGDTAAGLARAEQAVRIWTAKLAELPEQQREEREILERQLLHLKFNMANILRDQGEFERSRAVNAEILARQTTLLGETHPHTLMTAGGLAGDLRGLGRYAEALKLDLTTYRSWLDSYGEDHPRTLAALNNLAACYRLMGDFRAARERDEQALRRRQVVLGENNPFTLASAAHLGRDIRDSGDYERSVIALTGVHQACVATRGAESRAALTSRSNLAVSLRSAGHHSEAVQIHEEVYEKLNERFGPGNPETLSCRVSLALSRLSMGDASRAARELYDLEAYFRGRLGARHPHSLVCANNLAIAERASKRPDVARPWARKAAEGLAEVLGDRHPYTLSAQMNLAICDIDAADLEGARQRFQATAETMVAVLGPDHPNSLRCNANIALVSRELGEPGADDQVEEALGRLIERVGNEHPAVVALYKRHYLYRIIDPHPF